MWILPSLSRPEQCAEVLKQIKETGCTTPGIVFVNGNTCALGYQKIFEDKSILPDNWRVIYHPENIGALGALDFVFGLLPDEPWYGFIGDDEFVSGEEWDTKLAKAAGAWDLAHGVDNIYGGKRAQGYLVIGGELARAVGYLALRDCWHWYGLDDMWEALTANGACRNNCVWDVRVDHRHAYAGKAGMDECYKLGSSRKDIDQQVFFNWVRRVMPKVVERIKEAKWPS